MLRADAAAAQTKSRQPVRTSLSARTSWSPSTRWRNGTGRQPPLPLAKGTDGVWTVTIEPTEPNIYTYGFLVDGVRASDPSCRCNLTSAGRFSSSRFVIPAASPRAWEHQNKPAGALHHERFFSTHQGRMRPFVVYTPPG